MNKIDKDTLMCCQYAPDQLESADDIMKVSEDLKFWQDSSYKHLDIIYCDLSSIQML